MLRRVQGIARLGREVVALRQLPARVPGLGLIHGLEVVTDFKFGRGMWRVLTKVHRSRHLRSLSLEDKRRFLRDVM